MKLWKKKPLTVDKTAGTDNTAPILTDTQGSYTGHPFTPGEIPVQDADDL